MKKWQALADLIHAESAILADRNSADELKALYDSGRACVREVDGEIVAFAALFPTAHEIWLELGSMFVRKDHRGEKMSSELFSDCLRVAGRGMRVLVVTHNSRVIHLAERFGLAEVLCTKTAEPPDEIVCGPCDRVPNGEKHLCPFRGKRDKCAVFFL